MTRAVQYARVSREEQVQGYSIEGQLDKTRCYADQNGWDLVEKYVDPGYSARTDNRPAFRRMISDAKLGNFDVVLVLRSDRFARNRAHAALYKQLLKDVGVKVISVTEPVEEGSPAAVILEGMNEVIAEWYSVDLSVKITDAKRRRAESGLLNGMLPFGYEKGADGIAEHVHDESKLVRQAYEMYSSGNYTCQQIASWLNTTGAYPRTHRKERKARSSIGVSHQSRGCFQIHSTPVMLLTKERGSQASINPSLITSCSRPYRP